MRLLFRKYLAQCMLGLLRVHPSYSQETIAAIKKGGAIVCSNHVSLIDGIIIALASPIPLVFGVDTEFSRRPGFSRFGLNTLSRLGYGRVIPIDQNSPYGIRTLMKVLAAGESVMIFPEGKISESGRPQPLQQGLTWLTAKTKAQVVNIQIIGAERSRLFAKSGRDIWPKIEIRF